MKRRSPDGRFAGANSVHLSGTEEPAVAPPRTTATTGANTACWSVSCPSPPCIRPKEICVHFTYHCKTRNAYYSVTWGAVIMWSGVTKLAARCGDLGVAGGRSYGSGAVQVWCVRQDSGVAVSKAQLPWVLPLAPRYLRHLKTHHLHPLRRNEDILP
ncbi:hypothetical protein E2C01_002519 [Portunus trituberculatus]|uniref:Uncharacterized protein n=1 Tax=Portunus trituberculatus TaxID=210409 RepID=A0A5B7CM94_PORTR|nr:hypothetical protein [Portunus trituberculatus]